MGTPIHDFFAARRGVGGVVITGNPEEGWDVAWAIGGPYVTLDTAILVGSVYGPELRAALDAEGLTPDLSVGGLVASLYDYDDDDEECDL